MYKSSVEGGQSDQLAGEKSSSTLQTTCNDSNKVASTSIANSSNPFKVTVVPIPLDRSATLNASVNPNNNDTDSNIKRMWKTEVTLPISPFTYRRNAVKWNKLQSLPCDYQNYARSVNMALKNEVMQEVVNRLITDVITSDTQAPSISSCVYEIMQEYSSSMEKTPNSTFALSTTDNEVVLIRVFIFICLCVCVKYSFSFCDYFFGLKRVVPKRIPPRTCQFLFPWLVSVEQPVGDDIVILTRRSWDRIPVGAYC
ncbi:unnamed protein product [Trichobilharzia regenti]|nr:unnamed protein product [Trichobilharzia regenti]